jgi:hypothetical protein
MTILKDILSEIKSSDETEKIRILCDKIQKEENPKIDEYAPRGPNIFLCLKVPPRNSKEVTYLVLERESEDLYILVMYSVPILRKDKTIRVSSWEVEDHRAEKVLTQYAKKYKFLRGD